MDKLGNRTAVNVRDGNDVAYTVDNLTNRYRKVADANLAYDAAGNLTRHRLGYEYDVYGNPCILGPNFADDRDGKSDYDNPYLFTGRGGDFLDDGNLTLQINRHRYYEYVTGRWR